MPMVRNRTMDSKGLNLSKVYLLTAAMCIIGVWYSQTSLLRSYFIRFPRHPAENRWLPIYSIICCTVNLAYNDTRRGIRKVSLLAKCRCMCNSWMGLCSRHGNIYCRYSRIVVISAVVISEVDCKSVTNDFLPSCIHTVCVFDYPLP